MSVSSWLVTAFALRPPGDSFGHQMDRPTATPGRAASDTSARATNEPRSLKTRTAGRPRCRARAASSGWTNTIGSLSRRMSVGWAEKVEFRK